MSNHAANLPAWGLKLALRLAQLRAPGAYHLTFIVEPGGARRLIVVSQPSRVEMLGSDSCSDHAPQYDSPAQS